MKKKENNNYKRLESVLDENILYVVLLYNNEIVSVDIKTDNKRINLYGF
jgi:hypothetical protein